MLLILQPDPHMCGFFHLAVFQLGVDKEYMRVYRPEVEQEDHEYQGNGQNQTHGSEEMLGIEGLIAECVVEKDCDEWNG